MVFDFLKRRQKPFRVETSEERILREVGVKKSREESKTKSDVAKSKARFLPTPQERFEIGRRAGTFISAGASQRQDFTREQEMIGEMFGHGDKIWGINNEPVRMYHDLNPRQRGDNSTAELFGFG